MTTAAFPTYPKMQSLHKYRVPLNHECVVTEKIHGTNVRVMDNALGRWVGSRNMTISHPDSHVPQHDGYGFYDRAKQLPPLPHNHVLYGEWYGPGVLKGVVYSAAREFRVFDIWHPRQGYLSWPKLVSLCCDLGIPVVPVLYTGKVTVDQLHAMMGLTSSVAQYNGLDTPENIAEGVVVKPLVDCYDGKGNRIIAKLKSDKWAENVSAPKPKELKDRTDWSELAEEVADQIVTEGRGHTILDHITRDGNIDRSIKRTGDFVHAYCADVFADNSGLICALTAPQRKALGRTVAARASVMYRERLCDA